MLRVEGLRKRYGGVEVVRGVDFRVAPGECFGLLGPNGAGKTTTLKCCLGLVQPDAGEIELGGFPVPRQAREARYRVGVVPQFDDLDPDFTAGENLVIYGRYFGITAAAVRARIPSLLEFAGLADKAEARIDWAEPAARLHNRIRGLSPFPGAFFEADLGRGPERIKVLRAAVADGAGPPGRVLDAALTVACGEGALRLLDVQRAGKPTLDAAAFLRGTPIAAGASLATL